MVDFDEHIARALIARHAAREGPLLPILHDLQAEFGWIPEEAVRLVAHVLNLSRAEVHGVVSFYHDFRDAPEPRPVLKLCRAESCQARGADALAVHAEAVAGDRIAIETVYCLGLCSVGPNALTGRDHLHARLDAGAIDALVAAL
ncbi:NAD(P)H-dependent oxidoreductase subunit E [Flavisphingomonas formosensis]|uniref:NAD(P)H-dependent oxidoreductase subunit E n=1 Tax=Flavisphingomonas formosensis TaxID=861534 RepID=UPI0012F82626|nr:NAD(P)H-dependent oxidoreductase subunit E [Sphingomonas formosensis]